MNEKVEKYIKEKKKEYKDAVITKEFHKGRNILVRITKIEYKMINKKRNEIQKEDKEELYQGKGYERQRGAR